MGRVSGTDIGQRAAPLAYCQVQRKLPAAARPLAHSFNVLFEGSHRQERAAAVTLQLVVEHGPGQRHALG